MIKVVEKKLDEIFLYEKNPRNNDKAVGQVANSIKQFGFKVPIVIDKNNVIIAGHTRWKASKKLGLEKVPCIVADDLNEEQVRAFRLADNKVSELADWDETLLNEELALIDPTLIDMSEFGFKGLSKIFDKEAEEDDYDVVLPSIPRTMRGDVWLLGNHRLMCGDSTLKADVDKLVDGATMDMVLTDPPYNVDISNSDGLKIMNDNMDESSFFKFISEATARMSEVLKAGGAYYMWHPDSETITFRLSCEKNDMPVKQCLIWVKNGFNFGRQDYKWQHEPCLYGWKEGAGHYFVDEFNHPTVIDQSQDFSKLKKEELVEILNNIQSTVIHEDKPIKNDLHPTMKPIKILARMIKNSSKQEEKVLDLFGGSGSTLIACEQLDRYCYMMELDERYCDVIIDRWEKLTGLKAVKDKR